MRRHRSVPIVLCSAAALIGAAALLPVASASAAEPPSLAPERKLPLTLTPVDEIPAKEAAAKAAAAATRYPGAYGGSAWDAATKVLYVNLAAPTGKQLDHRSALQQTISHEVETAGLAVTMRFRSVPYSVEGRRTLIASVLDQRASWGGLPATKHVTGGRVDEVTGKVSVYAKAEIPVLQAAARRRFGTKVEVRPAGAGRDDGRYNDTAPWSSGNALWVDQFVRGDAHCTLGWNWRRWSDNQRYASTAGHCADPGESIFHASTTQRIGYVGTKYLNQNEHIDFEYVRITSGSVDNTVWVGGPGTSDLRRVVGADNDFTVCSSGANGGLACGRITSRDGEAINAQGIRLTQLTCVEPLDPNVTTTGGDSGGPWLTTYKDGTVMAWGQHKGRYQCDSEPDDEMMFSSVKDISARAGASLIVS